MKLTQKALEAVRTNKRLRARLALALDKSDFSVQRWIKENSEMLTMAASLKVIREETGLNDEEILEETESEGIRA